MKALVVKNKHKMCLAKAHAKISSAYKKMSVIVRAWYIFIHSWSHKMPKNEDTSF